MAYQLLIVYLMPKFNSCLNVSSYQNYIFNVPLHFFNCTFLSIIICLHMYAFTYSCLILIILKFLFNPWDPNGYYYSKSVYLGVMPMKGYSTHIKTPELETHHPMPYSGYSFSEKILPLWRGCMQRILCLTDWIISSLTGKPMKLVNQFTFLGNLCTVSDVNIRLGKNINYY